MYQNLRTKYRHRIKRPFNKGSYFHEINDKGSTIVHLCKSIKLLTIIDMLKYLL